jgi:tRNA(fMet)-specific endonuclease VapC
LIPDTKSLSALADGERGLEPHLLRAVGIAVPVIVPGEYRYGIRQSRNRAQYERWLGQLIAGSRILVVDESTAQHYADIRVELKQTGRPIPGNDMWISALARRHSLPLLSRDRHFDYVPGLSGLSW